MVNNMTRKIIKSNTFIKKDVLYEIKFSKKFFKNTNEIIKNFRDIKFYDIIETNGLFIGKIYNLIDIKKRKNYEEKKKYIFNIIIIMKKLLIEILI